MPEKNIVIPAGKAEKLISSSDGLDALLSTVQMPAGIPVATVAIDGAANAALLAIQILSVSDESLADKLSANIERVGRYVRQKRGLSHSLKRK